MVAPSMEIKFSHLSKIKDQLGERFITYSCRIKSLLLTRKNPVLQWFSHRAVCYSFKNSLFCKETPFTDERETRPGNMVFSQPPGSALLTSWEDGVLQVDDNKKKTCMKFGSDPFHFSFYFYRFQQPALLRVFPGRFYISRYKIANPYVWLRHSPRWHIEANLRCDIFRHRNPSFLMRKQTPIKILLQKINFRK